MKKIFFTKREIITFYSKIEKRKIFEKLKIFYQTLYLNNTHRENCVLLNSVQECFEIEAWLLLTFFICLYNQLKSTNV